MLKQRDSQVFHFAQEEAKKANNCFFADECAEAEIDFPLRRKAVLPSLSCFPLDNRAKGMRGIIIWLIFYFILCTEATAACKRICLRSWIILPLEKPLEKFTIQIKKLVKRFKLRDNEKREEARLININEFERFFSFSVDASHAVFRYNLIWWWGGLECSRVVGDGGSLSGGTWSFEQPGKFDLWTKRKFWRVKSIACCIHPERRRLNASSRVELLLMICYHTSQVNHR